jgi:hypothetical protein
MQIACYHCKKFFPAGGRKTAKSYQFCPVAIFSDSLVYLKAMHFRDVAFLLVLEDDPIPSKGGFPLLLFLEKFPYRVKFYTKPSVMLMRMV